MKAERKLRPVEPKAAKVIELEAKKKPSETEKEWRARIEAKIDLLLSRWKS